MATNARRNAIETATITTMAPRRDLRGARVRYEKNMVKLSKVQLPGSDVASARKSNR